MPDCQKYDITVVTPVLNASNFIAKCLKSVREQENVRIQHIVVDGGSDDDTRDIANSYGAEVYEQKGSSIYEALNVGVSKAQAPIIGFLNADDLYATNHALEKVFEIYTKNSISGIVYGNCRFINSRGKLLYRLIPFENISARHARYQLFNISHPAWFITKKQFKTLGGYDTSLRFVSDCDLIIRAKAADIRFIYTNTDIACFTLHSNNASRGGAASKEAKLYFQKVNGESKMANLIRIFLLFAMYARDPKYFSYRLLRALNLPRKFGSNGGVC